MKDSPGFTLEKDGSLKVDENFKVEGLDNVFAIGRSTAHLNNIYQISNLLFTYFDYKGDIARFTYHKTGESVRIEHWVLLNNYIKK